MKESKNISDEISGKDVIPLDDPAEFFKWLKHYHRADQRESPSTEKKSPNWYNYDGITEAQVTIALRALKEQRAGEVGILERFLRDLSPAQIVLLASNPHQRLYTESEIRALEKKSTDEEVARLAKLPGAMRLAEKSEKGVTKYIHATSTFSTARSILDTGLHCSGLFGLQGVAEALGADIDDNLRKIAGRHRGYDYLVAIHLPSNRRSEVFAEPLAQKINLHGGGIDYDSRIPPKFIAGFLDMKTGDYYDNPTYNESH